MKIDADESRNVFPVDIEDIWRKSVWLRRKPLLNIEKARSDRDQGPTREKDFQTRDDIQTPEGVQCIQAGHVRDHMNVKDNMDGLHPIEGVTVGKVNELIKGHHLHGEEQGQNLLIDIDKRGHFTDQGQDLLKLVIVEKVHADEFISGRLPH